MWDRREREKGREETHSEERKTEGEQKGEKTARKRGREGEKNVRHILCFKMKTLHGMKHNTQSVHVLPFISSNRTSHSIKQGHPQHTIKPHFHAVSISFVIFHTAYRAGYGQQWPRSLLGGIQNFSLALNHLQEYSRMKVSKVTGIELKLGSVLTLGHSVKDGLWTTTTATREWSSNLTFDLMTRRDLDQ